MEIAILAGGNGQRLRPLTYWTPKPLFVTPGETLLDRLLRQVKLLHPRAVHVVVHHLADRIADHLSTSDVHLISQPVPATLGSALATVAESVQDRCLILHGDNYFSSLPIAAIRSASPHVSTFFLDSLPTGQPDAARWAATGCYLLTLPALRQIVPLREADNLAAIVSTLLKANVPLRPAPLGGWRQNVNSVQDYLALQEKIWAEAAPPSILSADEMSQTVWISPEATVREARLGPRVLVGSGAIVQRSDLSDTIVLAGSSVEGAHLRRAVVGPGPRPCTVLMFGGNQ